MGFAVAVTTGRHGLAASGGSGGQAPRANTLSPPRHRLRAARKADGQPGSTSPHRIRDDARSPAGEIPDIDACVGAQQEGSAGTIGPLPRRHRRGVIADDTRIGAPHRVVIIRSRP